MPKKLSLVMEILEPRSVPATFVWDGPAFGNWKDPANWDGPDGEFPFAASDWVIFDGGLANTSVLLDSTLDEVGITLGGIEIKNGYDATIELHEPVMIDGAGFPASRIESQVHFDPKSSAASFEVSTGDLIVKDGRFGTVGVQSAIEVGSGTITFSLGSNSIVLGMDLTVNSGGFVKVEGDEGGGSVELSYDAKIEVQKGGMLALTGVGSGGSILSGWGASGSYLDVSGDLVRSGDGSVSIEAPLIIRNSGKVLVKPFIEHPGAPAQTAGLHIAATGIAATNQASVYVDGGEVILGYPAIVRNDKDSTEFSASGPIFFDGGTLRTHFENTTIAASYIEFNGNSHVYQGLPDVPNDLLFDLTGTGGSVEVNDMTWHIDVTTSTNVVPNDHVRMALLRNEIESIPPPP